MKSFFYDDIYAIDFCLLSADEINYVFKMRNNEKISKFMYSKNITFDNHLNFINNLKDSKNSIYWLFKYGLDVLGVANLSRIDLANSHAYVGIYKNPFLDSGYKINNLSAGKLILNMLEKIAYKDFGLHCLFLEVIESNKQAINFYEKNNYEKQGILKDFIRKDKEFKDVFIYSKILDSN